MRHGGGIFVSRLDARPLLEATGFALQLMRDHEVVELLEVRAILEGATAALSAARMADEYVRVLAERLEELDAATSADELLKADIAFHACPAMRTVPELRSLGTAIRSTPPSCLLRQ